MFIDLESEEYFLWRQDFSLDFLRRFLVMLGVASIVQWREHWPPKLEIWVRLPIEAPEILKGANFRAQFRINFLGLPEPLLPVSCGL